MELNYICMGDILRYLVTNLVINDEGIMYGIETTKIVEDILMSSHDKYTKKDILYALIKLKELDFIICEKNMKQINIVNDVTVKGHDYLVNFEL